MKKGVLVVLFAIMLGGGFAYFLFNKVVVKEDVISNKKVFAFQVGAFTSYDNAHKVAERNNGIVVDDSDIYRVYVAILNDDEAIIKLKEYYNSIGLNYYLKEIYVSEEFIKGIEDDEELLKRSDSNTYTVINNDVLEKYEEML